MAGGLWHNCICTHENKTGTVLGGCGQGFNGDWRLMGKWFGKGEARWHAARGGACRCPPPSCLEWLDAGCSWGGASGECAIAPLEREVGKKFLCWSSDVPAPVENYNWILVVDNEESTETSFNGRGKIELERLRTKLNGLLGDPRTFSVFFFFLKKIGAV